MAKQVKVFRGDVTLSVTGTTTIYTVPAGRVAKITIGALFLSCFNSNSQPSLSFIVGGITVASVTSTSGQQSFATCRINAVIGTTTSNIHTPGAGQKAAVSTLAPNAQIIDSEFYLMAGDTVVFSFNGSSPNTGSAQYSFSAVEEF
jgi:hypothetical protein